MCGASVRSPVLVGRDRELAALRSALAGARDGRGTGVAVLGAPGMGKTRLLRELGGQARAVGMPVLVGRAVEAGISTAFRPLTEALLAGLRHSEATLGEVDELMPFRPALGRLVPSWRVAGVGVDESPVVLAEGVLRVLRHLAGDNGLLLALEDLHWADPETLAVVEYLVDNLTEEPLLLVWTVRDDPGPAAPLARALAARGGALLVLTPLNDDDVATMSTACLGHEPGAELLSVLRRRAAGTPLLVEELLATGGADAATLIPATVHELVARRSAALSASARECVRAAAVLGPVVDGTLLPALLGTEPEAVLAALREAADSRLLEPSPAGFRFPHALIRDAVLATMLPPERATAATHALAVLRTVYPELAPPWDEVAADLALLAGDSLTGAGILLTAGRRDLDRGALATAEATLGRAAQLAGGAPRLAADVDDALAEVLTLAGKTDAAVATSTRLIARLGERTDRDRLAEAHLRAARVHVATGDWTAASTELNQARGLAERAADPSLAARIEAAAAHVALGRSDLAEAGERAATALRVAENHGDTDTACEALEVLGRLARRTDLGAAEALFERARAIAADSGVAVREARALHELSSIDALDSLRYDRLEAARQRALDIGALGTAAAVELHLAATAIMRWDVEQMRPLAWRAVASARRLRLATLPKALVLAGLSDVAAGQPDGGEHAFTEALGRAPHDAQMASEVWGARAHRWLLAGDQDRAFDQLERAMAVDLDEAIASPHVGLWLLTSATTVGAVPPLPDGVIVSRWNRAYLRLSEAVALGRTGQAADATAAFAEGNARMSAPVDARWHRRHARSILAAAALADGWGDPVRWLTEDLAFFETLGHDRLASACRGLLRRAGSPVPRRGRHAAALPEGLRRIGVTAREHEVLELVAQGLDNRGVAQRLVISPRTVEKHVERLLAKTGLAKRIELVAFAARGLPTSGTDDVE